MSNILKVSFISLMIGSAFFFLSNAGGAGNAQGADRTGSPLGIGTCGSCHDGGNFSPVINVTLLEVDKQVTQYIPGKLYQIKVTIEAKNNPKEYGFQLVALSGSNHQQAGIFGDWIHLTLPVGIHILLPFSFYQMQAVLETPRALTVQVRL